MKKCLVILLALAMVFSMGGAAFAEDYVEGSPVQINKVLTINNTGTVNPQETFNFTVGTGSGSRAGKATITAPAFSPATFSIAVAEGATTGDSNIELPTFTEVGVYTYPITEKAGNTAGMGYDIAPNNLVVTVINNPDYTQGGTAPRFLRVLTIAGADGIKIDSFDNNFNAGDLTINKLVTGNYGDPNDEFTVTVTLTPITGKNFNPDAIVATGGNKVVSTDKQTVTITYNVVKDSTFTIENVPYDVNYNVVEADSAIGYTVTYNNASGIMDASIETTTITNYRNKDIATGINLDNLPYLILLVSALGGLIVIAMKKRVSRNS